MIERLKLNTKKAITKEGINRGLSHITFESDSKVVVDAISHLDKLAHQSLAL
jgi:hypothetical protein